MPNKKLSYLESKSINSQTIYNIISTVAVSGINFFTIPIFTRLLGAEQYGMYSLFYSWMAIFSCFMSLGVGAGIGTAHYKFQNELTSYQTSTFSLCIISCILFSLLGLLFIIPLSKYLQFPTYVVILLLICTTFYSVVNFKQQVLIYEKCAKENFFLSFGLVIAIVVLSILLIRFVPQNQKYMSRVIGMTFPYVIFGTGIIIGIYSKDHTIYNLQYWKYALAFGLPVVFHALSNNILGQSDRIMLKQLGYAGTVVGIYSFYHSFTNIVQVILGALNTSWCPFYYDYLNNDEHEELKNKTKNYIEIFTIVSCGFIMLSREVCYLFANEEYWDGMNLIPVFILSIYATFMYQFPVNFELFNVKTMPMAIGTCGAGLINIILNYLFIPQYGMIGAAVATLLSHLLLFISHFIVAKHIKEKIYRMKIKDFLPGLMAIVAASGLFFILKDFWYVRWTIGTALGLYEIIKIYKRKSVF